MSRMFSLIGHSSFLILLLFSSVYSHSDHHQHIKDIIYKNIPFLAKSTTDNIGSSTTENPDINPTESSKLQQATNATEDTLLQQVANSTEEKPLQQGTPFENFKERLGWSLGALVSVPIVSVVIFCCFCYCLCKCCAIACEDDEKEVVVVQSQIQPTSVPPIIVQNVPVHQMNPSQQYHPSSIPQYYPQPHYSPTGAYNNPSFNQPAAPPPYNTKAY